jgi:hypothetical protein
MDRIPWSRMLPRFGVFRMLAHRIDSADGWHHLYHAPPPPDSSLIFSHNVSFEITADALYALRWDTHKWWCATCDCPLFICDPCFEMTVHALIGIWLQLNNIEQIMSHFVYSINNIVKLRLSHHNVYTVTYLIYVTTSRSVDTQKQNVLWEMCQVFYYHTMLYSFAVTCSETTILLHSEIFMLCLIVSTAMLSVYIYFVLIHSGGLYIYFVTFRGLYAMFIYTVHAFMFTYSVTFRWEHRVSFCMRGPPTYIHHPRSL